MYTLVGKKAPDFKATAVQAPNLSRISRFHNLRARSMYCSSSTLWISPLYVLPSYTPSKRSWLSLKSADVQVIGCSVDSQFSHFAWLSQDRKEGGIKGVEYPIVADFSKTIAQNYGVLAGEEDFDEVGNLYFEGNPVAYRGLFLIDKEGVVRHMLINDLPLGRSVDGHSV